MQQEITSQFTLYRKLLMFVGQQHTVKNIPIDLKDVFSEQEQQAIYQAREILVKNPQEEIIRFCKENPFRLNNNEISIVGQRTWMKKVEGLLMQHKKGYSLLMNEDQNTIYAIQGINQPIQDMIPASALPHQIEIVLMPYKGGIIWDGFVGSTNVYFGSTLKKQLLESMKSIILVTGVTEQLSEDNTQVKISISDQKKLADLVYYINEDEDYFKKEIEKLVQSSRICKEYYLKYITKKYTAQYKKNAKILGIGGYYIALYGNCICGVSQEKGEALKTAQSIVLPQDHNEIIVIKITLKS